MENKKKVLPAGIIPIDSHSITPEQEPWRYRRVVGLPDGIGLLYSPDEIPKDVTPIYKTPLPAHVDEFEPYFSEDSVLSNFVGAFRSAGDATMGLGLLESGIKRLKHYASRILRRDRG